MSRRPLLALAALAAGALVSCGGDDDERAGSETTVEASATTTAVAPPATEVATTATVPVTTIPPVPLAPAAPATTATTLPAVPTVDAPAPFGSAVDVEVNDGVKTEKWKVTVDGFVADATQAVLAENPSNLPPAEGNVFVLVHVSLANTGDAPQIVDNVFSASRVTGPSAVPAGYSSIWVPDPLYVEAREVAPTASVSGNMAFEVVAADTPALAWTLGDLYFATA